MPEAVLMWSAAVILAAVALAAAVAVMRFTASIFHVYLMRYRVRGLTRAQIAACRNLAADFRRFNRTNNGPVSTPVVQVRVPRGHKEDEESSDV